MKRLTLSDPRPWPELCAPTPQQWARWYPQLEEADRVKVAQVVLDLTDQANRCYMRDHDGLERWLEGLQLQEQERRNVVRYEARIESERARGLLHVWDAATRVRIQLGQLLS